MCALCSPRLLATAEPINHSVIYQIVVTRDWSLQVKMLEEVVRQLSHDLSLAELQQKASSSSNDVDASAGQSVKSSPATEREVKVLSARV